MLEVKIEPNEKLKVVSRLIFLGDTLGAGWGVEEAAIDREMCLGQGHMFLTFRGTSVHINCKIYGACVQCVITYRV